MKFTAVAFDLDGTLYHNSRLFVRLVPFLLKEHRLLRAMGKARKLMRQGVSADSPGDFYDRQALIMGELLGIPKEQARDRTDKFIYRGWEPLFEKVRLFPHVRETLETFRKAGIKLGLLSDFPPETKLKNLKISECWDTFLSSEETGHLKPHSAPFMELARRMEAAPEEMLYVGNSIPYDVVGAHNAGMKAAQIGRAHV